MVPDSDLLLTTAGDNLDKEMQSITSNNNEELHIRWTENDDDLQPSK